MDAKLLIYPALFLAFVASSDDHVRCPSSSLRKYVQDALDYYSGSDNAEGIAQRITNNIVANYDGAWITTVSQLNYDQLQWSYWGSNTIYGSSNFCLMVTNQWFVQAIKASV